MWLGLVLLFVTQGHAKFASETIEQVPVAELSENLKKELTKAKDEEKAGILVNLGRLHGMAYAKDAQEAPVTTQRPGHGTLPYFSHWLGQARDLNPHKAKFPEPPPAQPSGRREKHLELSLQYFRSALKEDPSHQLAQLGLSWALIQAGEKDEARTRLRSLLKEIERPAPSGVRAMLKTPGLLQESDPTPREFTIREALNKTASSEAGYYLAMLLDPVKDKKELESLRRRVWVDMLREEFRPRKVTPLALGLDGSGELLAPDARVKFDLVGNHIPGFWNWIKPSAAWLVYRHPRAKEPISGMHLFGETTFWLFWKHGFEPLCALDSSGDQLVSGGELENFFLWQDKNSNGVENKGELRSFESAGIAALDCRYEKRADGLLWNPGGAILKSGTKLPVVDVVLERKE